MVESRSLHKWRGFGADGGRMAMNAGRIQTMLPSTPQVESVYLDPTNGILAGIPQNATSLVNGSTTSPHTLLIDGTTLDPTAAVRIAQTVQQETNGGAVMLDAPVSGGKLPYPGVSSCPGIVAAETGALSIMFGSPSPEATALAVPMLERMAREGGVIACGQNGTGVGVKVCNKWVDVL